MFNDRTKELINDLRTSILRWYPFKTGDEIIYIGEEDAILCWLKEQFGKNVSQMSPEEIRNWDAEKSKKADYIISIASLETSEDIQILLSRIKEHLKPTGRLVLGMNNRLGIKYFCGDRDKYTDRNL